MTLETIKNVTNTIKNGSFVLMLTETEVKTRSVKSKYVKKVLKVSTYRAQLGCSYTNIINNNIGRSTEAEAEKFVALPMKNTEYIDSNNMLMYNSNTDNHYLRVYQLVDQKIANIYIYADTREMLTDLEIEELKADLPKPKAVSDRASEAGATSEQAKHRTLNVKIANVISVTVNGVENN